MKQGKRALNPFYVDVGWRIRTMRMKHKISMQLLADHIGISRNQINKYERGHDRINLERLQKIAEILEEPIGYFFGEAEEMSQKQYDQRILAIAAEIENTTSPHIRHNLYQLVKAMNAELGVK